MSEKRAKESRAAYGNGVTPAGAPTPNRGGARESVPSRLLSPMRQTGNLGRRAEATPRPWHRDQRARP
jgi:hypothetical protein